jgi:hypothetical protein
MKKDRIERKSFCATTASDKWVKKKTIVLEIWDRGMHWMEGDRKKQEIDKETQKRTIIKREN